jgi:hypothetical protein
MKRYKEIFPRLWARIRLGLMGFGRRSPWKWTKFPDSGLRFPTDAVVVKGDSAALPGDFPVLGTLVRSLNWSTIVLLKIGGWGEMKESVLRVILMFDDHDGIRMYRDVEPDEQGRFAVYASPKEVDFVARVVRLYEGDGDQEELFPCELEIVGRMNIASADIDMRAFREELGKTPIY